MSRQDGGPAFPHWDGPSGQCFNGLSLRDYFAAKAMNGMLDNHGDICDGYREQIALKAYLVADAMLAERGKP